MLPTLGMFFPFNSSFPFNAIFFLYFRLFEQNCGHTVIQPDKDFAVVNTGRTKTSLYYVDEERQQIVNWDGRHLATYEDWAYPFADTYLFMSDQATPFSRYVGVPEAFQGSRGKSCERGIKGGGEFHVRDILLCSVSFFVCVKNRLPSPLGVSV